MLFRSTEVAVLHERLDTIERLLSVKNILPTTEIEAFTPDSEQAEERQRWHASYVARVLRIVQQELESLQQDPENNRSMEEIVRN